MPPPSADFCRVAIHIGAEIHERVRQRGVSVRHFANSIGCSTKTVHALFKRPSIDTMLLRKCSEVLSFDFFALYSQDLGLNSESNPSRVEEPPAKYASRYAGQELEIVIRPGGDADMLERVLKAIDPNK